MAVVVLVGTLDTKGQEYEYLRERVRACGVDTLLVDTGILKDPTIAVDISAAEVLLQTGTKLADIRFAREGSDTRARAISLMGEGLGLMLKKLVAEGRCDGVIGLGGSGGTNMLSHAMQELPLGLPKLIVSTMMAGDVKPYVGSSDMTMMYSVTDIAGLNNISRTILGNAAHAIAGMAKWREDGSRAQGGSKRPLIGITMFGVTTPGVLRICSGLEAQGFDTIVFHATGAGGQSMERMVSEGIIDGVIDYTLAELTSERLGGIFGAGSKRLTVAALKNLPQVVVPGALEVLNFHNPDEIPAHLQDDFRKCIIHNSTVCAIRANDAELCQLAGEIGEKLNLSKGPVTVCLPEGGLDAYEAEGGPWAPEHGNAPLFEAIKQALKPEIQVKKFPGNVNNPDFADAVVTEFLLNWERRCDGGC